MTFDIYAFADYSGSTPVREQRKHIALARFDRSIDTLEVISGSRGKGLSRAELWTQVCLMLVQATQQHQFMVFGFDHSFSFPTGFYQALTGEMWTTWDQLLTLLSTSRDGLHAIGDPISLRHHQQVERQLGTSDSVIKHLPGGPAWLDRTMGFSAAEALRFLTMAFQSSVPPREWAASVNRALSRLENAPPPISVAPVPSSQRTEPFGGPFWGPNFHPQVTKPRFPFDQWMAEKRVVEQYAEKLNRSHMKSIYQLGGNGSVGLQALYGIAYLQQLREFCKAVRIPLFCWPFDGWVPPADHHVAIEVYPTLYNENGRTDEEDAKACVRFVKQLDELGTLFNPPVLPNSHLYDLVRLEGWVPGVPGDEGRIGLPIKDGSE